MKEILCTLTISASIAAKAIAQVIIDPIALIGIEDTSTRFCFNNTKLMAGKSTDNRYLIYYNSDTIFLNVNLAGNWTKKAVAISPNIESATMALHQDTIWACWKGGAYIRAAYSTDSGSNWTGIPNVSDGGNVSAPSVYASSNGKIHFAWSMATSADTTVYHRAFFNGAYLTPPNPLSNSSAKGLWPSIIAIGDTVLCAWKEEPLPTKVWFASSFNSGNTWSDPDTTDFYLPVAKDPNLAYAFDSSTLTHHVYLAYDGQDKIYLQQSGDFGNTWSPPQVISNPSKLSQFAHLECNNHGFVGVSYEHRTGSLFDDTQKDAGFVYSTSWGDSGSWSIDTLAYTHNSFGSVYSSFNKIDETNFYLAWLTKDTLSNKMKVYERLVHLNPISGIEYPKGVNYLSIDIFPNPFSSETTLQTAVPLKNASLMADNCFGQTVAYIKGINGQTITFSRNNLATGLYFVRLIQAKQIIAAKLVITD